MIGIIVISHGELASGMMSSLKMIDPDQKQIATLCVQPDTNPDDFSRDLDQAIQSVSTDAGVLILADILGGTPCNKAIAKLNDHVNLLTGVNLPMLLAAVTKRSTAESCDQLTEEVMAEAKNGISNLKELIKGEQ